MRHKQNDQRFPKSLIKVKTTKHCQGYPRPIMQMCWIFSRGASAVLPAVLPGDTLAASQAPAQRCVPGSMWRQSRAGSPGRTLSDWTVLQLKPCVSAKWRWYHVCLSVDVSMRSEFNSYFQGRKAKSNEHSGNKLCSIWRHLHPNKWPPEYWLRPRFCIDTVFGFVPCFIPFWPTNSWSGSQFFTSASPVKSPFQIQLATPSPSNSW